MSMARLNLRLTSASPPRASLLTVLRAMSRTVAQEPITFIHCTIWYLLQKR